MLHQLPLRAARCWTALVLAEAACGIVTIAVGLQGVQAGSWLAARSTSQGSDARVYLALSVPSCRHKCPRTRSESEGFLMTFSSSLPCAVATSCTPRCAIVRAATHSSAVPISSMTITCVCGVVGGWLGFRGRASHCHSPAWP